MNIHINTLPTTLSIEDCKVIYMKLWVLETWLYFYHYSITSLYCIWYWAFYWWRKQFYGIYIYIYMYIYGIHHWRIIWSSYRKLETFPTFGIFTWRLSPDQNYGRIYPWVNSSQRGFKGCPMFISPDADLELGHWFIIWKIKSYLCYKTITSQNASSETQVKNVYISQRNYLLLKICKFLYF